MLRSRFIKPLAAVVLGAALVVPLAAGPASANLPGDEGCTPGFWKNHPAAWAWTGYSPTQRVDSVWTVPSSLSALADDTLMDALGYSGGPDVVGAARILLRAATAALLNANDPLIDFPAGQGPINRTNDALASLDRATMITLAGLFDAKNNLGCPINGKEVPVA